MLTCPDTERLIARLADDAAAIDAGARLSLDRHVESCSACRQALDEQRRVANILRARPETPVRPGFSARVAARLDPHGLRAPGWLGIANWRAWTAWLAPLAAALLLSVWLGPGTVALNTSSDVPIEDAPTFDAWMTSPAGTTSAAVFLEPSASGDALLEAVLTGAAPAASGETIHVR